MGQKQITIAGAGLVGSLLGIYLAKRGYKVKIYERRSDMRKEKMAAGRSINLALSDRGIKALEEVGIMDEIRRIAIPMHGRYIHNADGTTAFQAYGKEGQFIKDRKPFNKKHFEAIKQVLTYYKYNFKDFNGLVFYEGIITDELLWNYTTKANDSIWLSSHK